MSTQREQAQEMLKRLGNEMLDATDGTDLEAEMRVVERGGAVVQGATNITYQTGKRAPHEG